MAIVNQFEYADWLSMECLRMLLNKLEVAQFFNTDYKKEFGKEFAVGSEVRIPIPQRFLIRDGLGYSPQPINRLHTTVQCDQIFGVDFEWDSAEQALKMERGKDAIKQNYLDPAMAQIAQEIDSRAARWAYLHTNNIVGVLGTNPTSFQTINQGRQRLIELAGWKQGTKRGLIIPPSVNTSMVNAAVQYFNPADAISKQYKEGSIGRNSGFDWYESMSLYTHTAGTWAGSVTVNGAVVDGATTIAVTATAGDTFLAGDVIGLGSIYAVNPSTRRTTTTATTKQVVVMQALTATGGGSALDVLQIRDALYGPGSQYQNVSALPSNGTTLTLFPGTTTPNGLSGVQALGLTTEAFALVGVKLESPKATEVTSQTQDPETGISVRFVRMFDPQQSKMINRFDVLLGFGDLYPDNCAFRLLCA